MSGNIKYIGKNNNTATQLPTSGFGFSVSNSDGKENALKKFASSFTDNKTKESMINSFTSENGLVDIITKNANNPKVLNNVLEVKQTPLNNKDCSVYTVSKKSEADLGQLVNEQNEASSDEVKRLKTENQQLRERNTELETDKNTSTANLQTQIEYLTSKYDSHKHNLELELNAQHETLKKQEINNLKEQLQDEYEIKKNKLISELTLQLQTQSEDKLLQQLLEKTSEIQKKENAIQTIEVQIQQLNDLNFSLEKMLTVLLDEREKNVVETKPISDIESMSAVALIVDSIIDTKENHFPAEFEEGSKPVDSLDLPPNIKPISNKTTPSSNIISKQQQPHNETFVRLSQKLEELGQNNKALKEAIMNTIANNKITQSRTTVEFMPFTESKQTVETQTENAPIPEETPENAPIPKDTSTIPKKTARVIKPPPTEEDITTVKSVVPPTSKIPTNEQELRVQILELAEKYFSKLSMPLNEINTNIGRIKRELSKLNITELQNALTQASNPNNPKFGGGSSKASRRHGKRIKSRKPRALKNKTKTRRYRKRSFTRRRK